MRRRVSVLLALPLLLLAMTMMATTPSGAVAATPMSVTPHRTVHFFPHLNQQTHGAKVNAAAFASNLVYNGGPVMTGTTNVYAIYWEPTGNVSGNYHSLINRYFGDVNGQGLYNNNKQYTQSGGGAATSTRLAGTWVDNSSFPESPLLDSDIQNEVSFAQSVNGWSSSIHNIFFVFLEAGQDLCFDSSFSQCASNAFCAYHSFFGSNTIYAAMPYAASFSCNPGSSPNNDDADQTINVTSHEQMEAATDPLLNAWFDSSGSEIGDKCAWTFGSLNSIGADVTWHGHGYIVQKEWDNARRGCVLSGP